MSGSRDPRSVAGRLEFVDCLRGFALFGVFWANLLVFSGIDLLADEKRNASFGGALDGAAFFLERFLIENKFMGLFSFLFGISFWLFLSRAQGRGSSGIRLFYRRSAWLFAIGAIHGWLFWCFDILRFYALWALFLPLFVTMKPRRLTSAGLVVGVLGPALIAGARVWLTSATAPAVDSDAMAFAAFSRGSYAEVLSANWRYDWVLTNDVSQLGYQLGVFGRLLLGLGVARTRILENLDAHRVLLRRVLLAGGTLGLVGSTIFAGNLLSGAAGNAWLALSRRLLVEGGQLGLTLAYASGLALAFSAECPKRVIRLLAPIGQMALTWYLLQTAFGIWLFYGWPHGPGLMGKVGPAALLALAVAGFAIQVGVARAWMRRFRFGPAEWCWRSLTYGSVQPFLARREASG